jgi:hypothetical protein
VLSNPLSMAVLARVCGGEIEARLHRTAFSALLAGYLSSLRSVAVGAVRPAAANRRFSASTEASVLLWPWNVTAGAYNEPYQAGRCPLRRRPKLEIPDGKIPGMLLVPPGSIATRRCSSEGRSGASRCGALPATVVPGRPVPSP